MMSLKQIGQLIKKAFVLLRRGNPLILASSTAFFTFFSLAPIIVLLINVLSLYFKEESISNEVFKKISSTFSPETAEQVESIVTNFQSLNSSIWITIAGSVFLVFVATTLLKVIKQAIHQLWRLKRKPSNRLKNTIKERLIAVSLLISIGLLFIISLLLDTSMVLLQDYLQDLIPSVDATLIRIINTLFSIIVVTAWFTILYKILPDAHVHWKVALPGGLLTSVLFNIGKYLLGKLLGYGNVATVFGASASLALILLFIFYASMIIYFGAAFTYAYAEAIDKPIKPRKNAEQYEMKVIPK